jgi:hypothetical protein
VKGRMYFQHDSLEGLISITIAGLEQLGTPGVSWEHVLTLKKSEDNSRHLIKRAWPCAEGDHRQDHCQQ